MKSSIIPIGDITVNTYDLKRMARPTKGNV